jgi:dolichol-phosphate mannosyltransferase
MYKLAIISPTYNESLNIPTLVERVRVVVEQNKIKTILLIVDDGSPDGTGDTVDLEISKLQSEFLNVELLQRGAKKGFASAYIEGIEKVKNQADFIMSMDADLSHQQKYIPDFINKAEKEGLDLVNGSRYLKGGGIQNWGIHRIILSRWAAFYCSVILWSSLTDYTSGYNLYRSSYIKAFDLGRIKAQGFFFLIEMRYKLIKSGARVGEVPIVFCDREFGQPKMSLKYMIENAIGVIKLKFSKN